MICPNCGEDNSSNFKFCGMCGTALEARRPLGAPRVANAAGTDQGTSGEAESRGVAGSMTAAQRSVPPATGPSFLGLSQPFPDAQDRDGQDRKENNGRAHSDQVFFGSNTFFEPDEPNVGLRRIILLLFLLAALGAGGWWAYSHYNKISSSMGTNSQNTPATPQAQETAANNPSPAPSPSAPSPKASESSPVETSSSPVTAPHPQPPAVPASPTPEVTEKTAPPPSAVKPAEAAHPSRSPNVVHARRNDTRASAKPAPRAPIAEPASDDKGDASFRKGTAYLYGQGAPQNCDEAIKNLKAASAKQNAKARSTFGTMYATGHCVPRDLPSSYSWFALALRVDPNNQILEKDLVAVWNQMTPPERQMATKMKQ